MPLCPLHRDAFLRMDALFDLSLLFIMLQLYSYPYSTIWQPFLLPEKEEVSLLWHEEMSLLYCCRFPQMHITLPVSEGMCIFIQSWKRICLNQPLDWACIHSLVLTHPPTQRLTKFWPDSIQLTWISHFLAKQFPSQARWPLPRGYIVSVMP